MASVAEQQSHKEKLDNARATRGHRRTQSNSQYEFTQLKVSTPSPVEELTEEAKRNKEEFNKIVEQNRIIGANLTQQALEAQKNSKEEKRTIIDCIEEDLVGVNSADKSTFAFGKKLCHGQKKRHNSDVVGALYRQSPLESGNGYKNGIASCGIQKEEDDDESEDDFDSLFFAKYKKFGGAGRLTLPVGSGDGLSIIPELATDLVTSTEFGTSMFKDNNLANHNSNSNSLPTNNSNKSLPNNMDKALTSNSNNSSNQLGGKQSSTPQPAVGVEHLPQINNLTQMNGTNKGEGNHNFQHKSDKNNKCDAPHNLSEDLHEIPQRTLSTYDNISIYSSTQNPSQSANPSAENEGFSHPPKKIKDSSASAALSSLVASLKNSQALNSNSNNSSNTCQNQIIQKTTQPTELDTAETQVSAPSRSPTVGQSATRPQHQRGESSLQFGQNHVQSFLSSNEGSQYNRANKRNSIHEILGASNNLPSNANNMGNVVAAKNYSGNQLQQQPLEHHLNQQKNVSQPKYTTQNSQHPSELHSIVEILPSPKDQTRLTGNTTSTLVHPQLKSEKMLDSKENQLPQNHNPPQIYSNNSKKTQNPNFDNKIQQDSSVQPLSAKHPSNKSGTSSSLQVSAAPQIISTSTAAANRNTNNKSNNQFQNAVTWLQHSSILPLASDKSIKHDIQEQQQQPQQHQHSRTGSSSIVNVSNLVSSSTFSAHNYSNNHGASNNNLVASTILGSGYETNNNNNNNNCSNFNHANYSQNTNNNNNQRNLNNTSSSNSGSSSSSVLSPGIGDMDTQSKTYSQIIKDFLYKSNNSTTNSQYQQMHQEQLQQQAQYQQYSICTNNNNKPTSSSKKISSLASKETKKPSPTAGIKQSTASTLSTNGNNSLEGRIFMLESKVLSLKCKTETLEKQNLNLTQEVMKISDEKEVCLKENAESKQRLLELEGITRRNEESIQLIYKMLCKSQSDYELLRAQKTQQYQEASTNIFTDLSCIESPNEVRAGQKQILLPKNMNQIVEQQLSDCNPYKNSHSAHSSNREKDGMMKNNNNSNLKMVSPQTYTHNSMKFHNENSSFNSLLQQRKHQSYKPQQGQQFSQYSPYQQQVLSNGNNASNGVNNYQNTNDGFKQGIVSHSQYQPHRLM